MSMSDMVCGIGTFLTTYAVCSSISSDAIWNIIASLISAIIYAAISVAVKIITTVLEKKGIISPSYKKIIDNTADDLADDGKVNGSNKPKVDPKESDDVK